MRTLALVLSISTLLATSGCSVHKVDAEAGPSITASEAYSLATSDNKDKAAENAKQKPWWEYLERPELNTLIKKSFQSNQDLAQALARIEQARAMQRSTGSARFPELSIEGSASERQRGNNDAVSSEEIGAALNWEIDIFNRIGSAAKADELSSLARVEDYHALKLSLSAELAKAYFGAVAAHNVLQVLNEQFETDSKLLELTELRLETGVGTKVETLQQASRVAESESLIPTAQAQLRVFENRIDVLLGEPPDGLNRIEATESLTFSSELPSVGIPADLLLKRPDLRAAQTELVAADADIASAIAERLPRLTLEGSYMYDDDISSDPLAIITGSFIQPLLDWGRRRAQVKRNKALYTEQLAAFSQRYLEAIEEVENTLYQEHKQREYVHLLEKRRQLLQNTLEETEALYTQGVSDYLPVLNALQELREVERDLVAEQLNLVNFRISLHRALGGTLNNNQPSNRTLNENHSLNEETL